MNLRTASIIFALAILPTTAGAEGYEITRAQVARLSPGMQIEIAGLQYHLNPYQLRQFFALPTHAARRAWIDRFWRSQDPTPATEVNEMRDEHNLRVRFAHDLYRSRQWPGWDRRGEVYIRYGPPNVRAKIHAEVTARKTHPPGELWYYSRHGMLVMFRDESLTGNYIYAINALGAAQDLSPDLAEFLIYDADTPLYAMVPEQFMQFYRDPEFDPDSIDPDWNVLKEQMYGAMQVRGIRPRVDRTTERWDEDMDPDTKALMPPGGPSDLFHIDKVEKMANQFQATLDDTPTSYPFNFDNEELTFYFDIGQFKGGDRLNRVEVNLEFPVEETTAEEAGASREYTATAVFWDADYHEIDRVERKYVLPVTEPGAPERLWPAQLVSTLKVDYYRMAVSLTEMRAMLALADDSSRSIKAVTRSSSYRSNVTGHDFSGDLAISDILFAQKIGPPEKTSPWLRGAVEVIPHPVRRYRRGGSLPIYFEVYNLSVDQDGLSSFEVEYRIVAHSEGKKAFWDRFDNDPTAVASRFNSSGYGPDETVYVTVKTENLPEGTYDFLITIKDSLSQSLSFRRATFRIVK